MSAQLWQCWQQQDSDGAPDGAVTAGAAAVMAAMEQRNGAAPLVALSLQT